MVDGYGRCLDVMAGAGWMGNRWDEYGRYPCTYGTISTYDLATIDR